MCTTSMLLITALLVNGLPEMQVLRKASRGQCHGQPTTATVTQALLQCAMNSFKMTDRLQPASLQLSSECPKEVYILLVP
jgi:hypothetical protein